MFCSCFTTEKSVRQPACEPDYLAEWVLDTFWFITKGFFTTDTEFTEFFLQGFSPYVAVATFSVKHLQPP